MLNSIPYSPQKWGILLSGFNLENIYFFSLNSLFNIKKGIIPAVGFLFNLTR